MASAPPLNAMDPYFICSPPVPYASELPHSLEPGMAIVVKGCVLEKADSSRFNVDLCCGLLVSGNHRDNKALHFNPRFDVATSWFSGKPDRQIVINSLINNVWGNEERYGNVLKEGSPFHLRILVLKDYFKIAIDGRHLCDYLFKVPLSDIRTIFISGCVSIDFIHFQVDDGRPVLD
ncbi:hypothetical protein AB6A40_009508 [Gnathostoma spinigerum]|uniref:Galectin n=1 Tax=Gnathostoma spinigerum TaxID=75299 RepID=A0ABD6ES61_9BILA